MRCSGSAGAGAGTAAARSRAATDAPAGTQIAIRVNQVGYDGQCRKQALVMSSRPLAGSSFVVHSAQGAGSTFRGHLGAAGKPWSAAWPYVYSADFTALQASGRYTLTVAGAVSPRFRIASAGQLYAPLAAQAVHFFQAQRDGPAQLFGPMHRQPSHLLDARALLYAQPSYRDRTLFGALKPTGVRVDAQGGWFDAGDYLKFVETASFDEVLLLIGVRDYPAGSGDRGALLREARFGLEWLQRMWDPRRRVLYYQVGIGDGNRSGLLGDHDLWRLPQSDDTRPGAGNPRAPSYFIAHRPVFAANHPGGAISPNLAGRVAAAFALCAQVFAQTDRAYAQRCERDGREVYALADQHPRGQLLSTSPHAYYDERQYLDDLALGAIELYLGSRALGEPGPDYGELRQAGVRLDDSISASTNGRDSLNLYDVSSLAAFDVARTLQRLGGAGRHALDSLAIRTNLALILSDQRDQLAQATRLSAASSFGLANPATNQDTVPHALGYAIQARLYDALTHSKTFEGLAGTQLDWVLGRNPWGSSFVVGAGATFPHCLAHQIANLSGSLSGSGNVLAGATVDGPNDPATLSALGAPDGYRRCSAGSFGAFNTKTFGYLDDARAATTSEPSNDYAALALLAFAQAAQQQTR